MICHPVCFSVVSGCFNYNFPWGPTSRKKNEPRVIDIDILAYETMSVELGELKIPHPQLFARKFVLVPWAEIAPDFVVQDYGKSVSELLTLCPDSSNIKKYKLEKTA